MEEGVNQEEADIFVLAKVQSLMNQAGITKYILDLISKTQDFDLLDTWIDLLNSLMLYSNIHSQKEILKHLKNSDKHIKFFIYLKERLRSWYIKTTSFIDNPIYNLRSLQETKFEERKRMDCLNILDLIQSFWGNCFVEFQDYLQSQESRDETQSFISIDLVSEVLFLLERISKMKNDLFFDPISTNLAVKILKTLMALISGPSFKNQLILGTWKRMYRILNFFINQDLQNYAPITDEKKAKINLFWYSVNLISLILR